jgi:hypothetical protein
LSRGGSWQAREYSRTCTDIQRLACNILCLKTLLLPCYFSSVVLFTPPIDFWCLPMFEDILFSSPSTTSINPLFSSCLFGLISSGRILSRGTVEGLAEMMYWIGQCCASWRMLQRAAKRSLAETSPWIPQQCNIPSSWSLFLNRRRGLRGRGMRGGGIDVAQTRRILVFNATSRVGTSPNHRDFPFRWAHFLC